jgi:two-component system LytT family response regulator
MIRTLVADDELLARKKICQFLKPHPEVQVAGQCATGRETVAAVRSFSPDLLFLDVQMPDLNGFEVLEAVLAERMPCVIFVTAYDRYAVSAFEVGALDYLLKPFSRERFERALKRAKAQIEANPGDLSGQLRALIERVREKPRYLERLLIKSAGTVFFLKTEEIDWIEAEENYVRLHCGRTSYLVRQKIGALESQLDPSRFRRIHRSSIVNLNRIQKLHPHSHGDYRVILESGAELMLSRGYRDRLDAL